MGERTVVNASPMIALLAIGREQLLPALFDAVLMPAAVRDEIMAGWAKDASADRLPGLDWLELRPDVPIPEAVLGWGLGRGESSVLAIAAAERECRPMLDDLAARRCARFLGIEPIGTGRVLVLAKQRGLLASVRAELDRLTARGFRLSASLVNKLLTAAAEAP